MTDEPVTMTLASHDDVAREPAEAWTVRGAFALATSGRYVVEDELARGAYGRIMRARDLELRRVVALKELLPEAAHARARFEREALLGARLQHPSIIPVYDTGCWPGGVPFISMKLVTGQSLQMRLAEAPSAAERLALLPVVVAIADAIAYAHGERVIHRDLKPANVLVGEFGEVVVIDWGLAVELGRPGPGASPAGTPGYVAPEQAAGATPDERTDVFALGAILHHVLAGEPPVPARSLREAATATPRPVPQHAPVELRAIVERAMARDPAARYPTARELAADLERFQAGQLVSAHSYSAWSLIRRFVRRHRAAVTIAAALLAVVATVASVSLVRIRDANRDAMDSAARARSEATRATAALAAMQAEERARHTADERRATTEAARRRAETQVEVKEILVQQSREELVKQNARLATALRETERAKARAEQASGQATRSATDLEHANARLTESLDRERARVKELEDEQRRLSTELKDR